MALEQAPERERSEVPLSHAGLSPLCFISPASPAFLLDSFSVFNLDSKGTRSERGQGVRIAPESTKVSFNSAVSFSPLSTLPACDLTSGFRYPK